MSVKKGKASVNREKGDKRLIVFRASRRKAESAKGMAALTGPGPLPLLTLSASVNLPSVTSL